MRVSSGALMRVHPRRRLLVFSCGESNPILSHTKGVRHLLRFTRIIALRIDTVRGSLRRWFRFLMFVLLVVLAALAFAAPALAVFRSLAPLQLAAHSFVIELHDGGQYRTRTCNFKHVVLALYQLSYSPKKPNE